MDYAAVPVENTLGGSIHVNYDLLLRYHGQVHILGEHVHRVRHTLMALPGVRKDATILPAAARVWAMVYLKKKSARPHPILARVG